MTAESGITLANGKGHLSTAFLKKMLKDGLLRSDVYGEALDLQRNLKCKEINDKHTI
jgi:hypothetical protein